MSESDSADNFPYHNKPSFCSLLREISKIKPKSVANRRAGQETRTSYPALQAFNRWLENLRKHYSPLPLGTTATCFRLLFPEEDAKRKYDIQETRLARYLSEALGIPLEKLENWDSRDATGCFGAELERLLQLKSPVKHCVMACVSLLPFSCGD